MTSAVYIGQFDVGSAAWHDARRNGLGGSEIAAVLGLSPFESRFTLWHRKAGTVPPIGDNPLLEWGRRLEDVIAAKYADEHPEACIEETGMWRNADRPWQLASPDRFDGIGGVIECKTARDDLGWGEPGTDEIPVYYRCQTLWYLDALGLDRCHVAVLIGGSDYREYTVTASPDEAEIMRGAAVDFLATLAANERPPIDSHDETYRLVREQHPDIEPVDKAVPDDLGRAYLDAVAAAKAADAAKKQATAQLADALGSARRAYLGTTHIATRIPGRNGGPPYVKAAPVKEAGQKVSAA